MKAAHVGYGLLAAGTILQVVEGFAHADAVLNNTNFSDSAVGKLVTPVEGFLPISLGWTLIVVGAGLVWILPMVSKG